jgi:hypothetical protein
MACVNPDTNEVVNVGDTACHDNMLYVCTVQGWRNTGAPCGGQHLGQLTNPPPSSS